MIVHGTYMTGLCPKINKNPADVKGAYVIKIYYGILTTLMSDLGNISAEKNEDRMGEPSATEQN